MLFTYIATHLLNHAAGIVSLDAAEATRVWFLWLWRNAVGTTLLYGSLLTHLCLALWAVYRRRSLRMPPWEAAQLLLGLSIPPLLIDHIIGTRGLHQESGLDDTYTYVTYVLWTLAPWKGIEQMAVITVAWLHGCIGLHFWLRLKPWYRHAVPLAYATALLLPTLGVAGFIAMGREVADLAQSSSWRKQAVADYRLDDQALLQQAGDASNMALGIFVGLLLFTLLARWLRAWWARRHGLVRITYPANQVVTIHPGTSVLEASRNARIPHASVCGGRGRCSTCRVRISVGVDALPAASDEEKRVLTRVGAAPNVRLACQLRPTADLAVVPLLPPSATTADTVTRQKHLRGEEREVAILFADLRGFTRLSEGRLPYDLVFVLNRYFEAMGQAVEHSGGLVDKFIGDGVMALFGVDQDPETACRNALAAAQAMAQRLTGLNESLAHELEEPLRIGIGIHVGPAIVGEMGYARATSVTAIGDAVNTASRLEALTKEYGAQLVVSEEIARRSGISLDQFDKHHVDIRGRREPLEIRVIVRAADLPGR
ncbi:MAG: adenylate/guanylate cyclase domain-containing protein [Alphaproteobacteria bacterium]|nr:adenylate/guanylate cyclase domain-containing protein [Alphaproteobacteria bacterium]